MSDTVVKKNKQPTNGLEPTAFELDDLLARVAAHMQMTYRVSMDEIEITDAPGYWRDKDPKMHPFHPLHGVMGCTGPFMATYTYLDPPRMNGRFASRTRTWAMLRDNVW